MAIPAKWQPGEEAVAALDLIFSCSICHDTYSEVYRGHNETVQGFSDGFNNKDRLVTRLYLASCCHVICIKHIGDGAGPPFHVAGARPQAHCTKCAKERADSKPKDLYSIRGFKKGEHDSIIPEEWFMSPPIRLDTPGRGMEALRFQYLSLIRYGSAVSLDLQRTKILFLQAQIDLRNLHQQIDEEQSEIEALKQENKQLRASEQARLKFKARIPAIEHYLRLVPTLAEQNDKMRQRLTSLGFSMPFESVAYSKEPYPFDENGDIPKEYVSELDESSKQATLSHTADHGARKPAIPAGISSPQARPPKRSRQSSGPYLQNNDVLPSSREMMPPPSKPLSRMRSLRNMIPTFRRTRRRPAAIISNGNGDPSTDVQLPHNEEWNHVGQPSALMNRSTKSPSNNRFESDSSFYMTGALPVGHSPRSNSSSLNQVHETGNRAANHDLLPKAPSYIHLLNDLGRDPHLSLELQDPRRVLEEGHRTISRTDQSAKLSADDISQPGMSESKRWNYGHAFLHQRANGTAGPAHLSDGLQLNPRALDHDGLSSPRHAEPRTYNISNEPMTPAPNRSRRQEPFTESVVSPFFRSNERSSVFASSGVAERKDSPTRSNSYQYRRQRMEEYRADWREPRSLNGLSFFNSPLNQRNEPIDPKEGYIRKHGESETYQGRDFDSQLFLRRPEITQSPMTYDPAYTSSTSYPSRRAFPGHSVNPSPQFSRSQSRAAPHPPTILPVVSANRSPTRSTHTDWSNLAYLGNRGGRSVSNPFAENKNIRPPGSIFASAGRRRIQR